MTLIQVCVNTRMLLDVYLLTYWWGNTLSHNVTVFSPDLKQDEELFRVEEITMTCGNLHDLWETARIFILLISFMTMAANQLAPFGVVSNLCGLLSFYQIIIVHFFHLSIERRLFIALQYCNIVFWVSRQCKHQFRCFKWIPCVSLMLVLCHLWFLFFCKLDFTPLCSVVKELMH